MTKISQISVTNAAYKSEVFEKILTAINAYLVKNEGAVPDFNLVKDIVERNTDGLEEEIEAIKSVPLYLGLLGTMAGIFLGLLFFDIGADGSEELANPEPLLEGVQIAMIASMTGLLLTTLLSSFLFKNSKIKVENRKNEFYTFIQVQLLPILNQNVTTSLYSLQQNLANFNQSFTSNVVELKSVVEINHDTLKTQQRVIADIEKIDLTELAKVNVNTFKELTKSVKVLEKFNNQVVGIDRVLKQTNSLSSNLESLTEKFENYANNSESIANGLVKSIKDSQDLMAYIKSHFQTIKNHGTVVTNAVSSVEHDLNTALKKFSNNTNSQINRIFEERLDWEKKFSQTIKESVEGFAQLKNLQSLKEDMHEVRVKFEASQSEIEKKFNETNTALRKLSHAVVKGSERSIYFQFEKIFTKVLRIFKKK